MHSARIVVLVECSCTELLEQLPVCVLRGKVRVPGFEGAEIPASAHASRAHSDEFEIQVGTSLTRDWLRAWLNDRQVKIAQKRKMDVGEIGAML
jgi:hypothetical protein